MKMIVSVPVNKALSEHCLTLSFVSSLICVIVSLLATPAELSSCSGDCGAHRAKNIYCLALSMKHLPAPDLGNKSLRKCDHPVQGSVQ